MRQHTWTIITDEPNVPTRLNKIFPGKNTFVSQPNGTICRTYVTYDPVTPEQHALLLQLPQERPQGIRGMSVSSLEVGDLVDPTKMTQKERDYLVQTFKGIAQQFQAINRQLITVTTLYPGLASNEMFTMLRDHLVPQVQGEAESLSGYIRVAHHEEWKQKG